MSRVTLSSKEIKELTISVAMLPFPPIPVRLKSYSNVIDIDLDKDKYNAFEMATVQLRKDAKAEDGILNSHSVISAIILYNRWRPKTASTDVENKELIAKMDMEKTKATIRLQYGVFSIIKADGDAMKKQDEIYNLFFEITQEWIDIMSPEPGNIMLERISDIESIGREHPLHIVASHYCYAQGVLYSNKENGKCAQHERLENEYEARVEKEANGDATHEELNLDHSRCREKSMHIAEEYSKNPYASLVMLCFDRLKNDCLYGYENATKENNTFEEAVALLKLTVDSLNNASGPRQCLELDFSVFGVSETELGSLVQKHIDFVQDKKSSKDPAKFNLIP